MQKVAFDPRWLSTPIGGAVGLLIARRALQPKDRTPLNLGLGTAAGAGVGYVGGTIYKGLSENPVPGDDWAKNIQGYTKNFALHPHAGAMTDDDRDMIQHIADPVPNRSKPGDDAFTKKYNDTFVYGHAVNEKATMALASWRIAISKAALADKTLPANVRQLHEKAIPANQQLFDEAKQRAVDATPTVIGGWAGLLPDLIQHWRGK